jgi:hypothetical protein
VLARFDSGDPWIVERGVERGRVVLLAAPLDAQWSTLPVNPDFVPWLHTLIFHLADPAAARVPLLPGEPIRLDLPPGMDPGITTARVQTPDGRRASSQIIRQGGSVELQFDETEEPGVYEVERPADDGPFSRTYIHVMQDTRESDTARLEPSDAATLSEGWPLAFLSERDDAAGRVLAREPPGPRPAWRWIVVLALAGLCLEVVATRALARHRALPEDRP